MDSHSGVRKAETQAQEITKTVTGSFNCPRAYGAVVLAPNCTKRLKRNSYCF